MDFGKKQILSPSPFIDDTWLQRVAKPHPLCLHTVIEEVKNVYLR